MTGSPAGPSSEIGEPATSPEAVAPIVDEVLDPSVVPALFESAARAVFGTNLPVARRYAATLCSIGMERGVIGPSEAPRIWERHLLNSAAIADAFAPGAHVVDVGSGAGLPGIPLALARPDLTVTLLESLTRRVAFLDEVVEILDLAPRVRTVKARAEEHRQQYDAVTARAVAPLDKLGRWTARLVPSGGVLIAIRGANAVSELKESRMDLTRSGWKDVQIDTYGDEPSSAATVIRAVRR